MGSYKTGLGWYKLTIAFLDSNYAFLFSFKAHYFLAFKLSEVSVTNLRKDIIHSLKGQ
jgi:hypothetical protein